MTALTKPHQRYSSLNEPPKPKKSNALGSARINMHSTLYSCVRSFHLCMLL